MGPDRYFSRLPAPPWLVIFLLCLTGCSGAGFSDKAVQSKGPVASVNGAGITSGQFEEQLKIQKEKYRIDPDKPVDPDQLSLLKAKTMDEMIRAELFRQEADKRNIRVTSEEFNRAMAEVKGDYHEEVSLQKIFQIEGVKREAWENKLRDYLRTEKLVKEVVGKETGIGDSALKEYFEKHPEEFKKAERVRALHIMVATEEEALAIRKKLETGVEKFSNLAIQYSLGPEGVRGGDLGYFEAGRMPEEFDGVFKLKVNKVSDVIQTPYGYHILKVIDKEPARDMKFKEARNIIRDKLTRQRREETFQKWLKEVRSSALVEINQDMLDRIG